MNKNKLIKIIILIICIVIFFIFFYINMAKNLKTGNNNSSQEIVDYILNISSYETVIEVEVNSNKNTNKYVIKQKYISPNISEQEVLEPTNIQGVKISKNGNELKVEHTKLSLSKIYNNYEYMIDNCIDLNSFIEDYKNNENKNYEENQNEIIMNLQSNKNKYTKYKTLYIDKKTEKPTKMEIKDNSKKTVIYILYKEVKINNVK